MRASRLLSILLSLQTRGLMTAQELADELEVSVRTVYRDVDALSAAGIPVYAERGPAGGYRLLDGFRTRVNGLTHSEAESLFLAALPGQADELGLGPAVASAQLKVLAGLPPDLRERAAGLRRRFLLDAPGWYRARQDELAHLAPMADAVWQDRRIRVRYRRWGGEVDRILDPYALVLKGGTWYLVARAEDPAHGHRERTYRVSRVLDLDVLDDVFDRDPDFDLPAYWARWSREAEERMRPHQATVRLTARGLELARYLCGEAVLRRIEDTATTPDARGRIRAVMPLESLTAAATDMLRFGAELEVLDPPELRASVAATARAVGALYDTAAPDHPAGDPTAEHGDPTTEHQEGTDVGP